MKTNEISKAAHAALLWIEVLMLPKSEQHPQGKGMLLNEEAEILADRGYCCLGLECMVADREYKPEDGEHPDHEAVGLLGSLGEADVRTTLSQLNDAQDYSFKDIGKQLKTFPEAYFTEEVARVIKLAYS